MTESWCTGQSRFNQFSEFFFIKSENSRFHHVCVSLLYRDGNMTGCLFKNDILANKLETKPSDHIKNENAEDKLVGFSNPARKFTFPHFHLRPCMQDFFLILYSPLAYLPYRPFFAPPPPPPQIVHKHCFQLLLGRL